MHCCILLLSYYGVFVVVGGGICCCCFGEMCERLFTIGATQGKCLKKECASLKAFPFPAEFRVDFFESSDTFFREFRHCVNWLGDWVGSV